MTPTSVRDIRNLSLLGQSGSGKTTLLEKLLATAGAVAGVKAITPAGYLPGQYSEGERPICVGRQRFEILYYTPQGAPATTL